MRANSILVRDERGILGLGAFIFIGLWLICFFLSWFFIIPTLGEFGITLPGTKGPEGWSILNPFEHIKAWFMGIVWAFLIGLVIALLLFVLIRRVIAPRRRAPVEQPRWRRY